MDATAAAAEPEVAVQPPILAVRHVTKTYGGVHAVQDVTLAFPSGSVTAILGDNGAGKTTLIRIMSGIIQPDEGSVEVDGVSVRLPSPASARGYGIETVHQDLALADQRDVVENMFMGRELSYRIGPLRFLNLARMRAETSEVLDELKVTIPSIQQQVRLMSGGQRQAIAIGRAVHWGSRALIMDEPMAALGLQEAGRVQELVETLRQRGLTQIIVSHNLDHVFRLATRIAVMRLGRLVGVVDAATSSREDVLLLVTGLSRVPPMPSANADG